VECFFEWRAVFDHPAVNGTIFSQSAVSGGAGERAGALSLRPVVVCCIWPGCLSHGETLTGSLPSATIDVSPSRHHDGHSVIRKELACRMP
jgi:hypothetical protein